MAVGSRFSFQRIARLFGAMLLGALISTAAVHALDPVVCIDEGVFVPPPLAPDPVAMGAPFAGEIYEGATPPDLDPDKPVLVFVQGLHGAAADWRDDTEYYGHNDMYDAAFAAGYKAFFVDLYDATGEARTSIENGQLLKKQIRWLTNLWGVREVNVIAHSKGGPDANFAAVSGARINTIVSLSGAHWGSPLADLAQSSWFDWLADLLGFNDEGTRFLQTGCMELMRPRWDSRPANDALSFYTAAATGWGPLLSSLEFGGLYLAGACPGGSNDGLVCVEHAKHPLGRDAQGAIDGQHRLVWDAGGPYFEADHDNIRKGSAFFDFFWPWEPDDCYVPIFGSVEPYAGTLHDPALRHEPTSSSPASRERPLATLLRGGTIDAAGGGAAFPVESGAESLAVRVLWSDITVHAQLRDPTGMVHPLTTALPAGGPIFRGAFASGVEIENPVPGEWTLEATSEKPGAFALLALLDDRLDLGLSVVAEQDGTRLLSVEGEGGSALSIDVDVRRVSTDPSRPQPTGRIGSTGRELRFSAEPVGVYNLSVTVRGIRADGFPFERNAVVSLGMAGNGAEMLPTACE